MSQSIIIFDTSSHTGKQLINDFKQQQAKDLKAFNFVLKLIKKQKRCGIHGTYQKL